MPFGNYQALCDSIADWLARDDLAGQIKDFVWLTECDLQRTIKFRSRDEVHSGTTIDGQDYIELPDDYLEGAYLNWTSDDTLFPLQIASLDKTLEYQKTLGYSVENRPVRIGTIRGDRLYVGDQPGEVDYDLHYKAAAQHLSDKVKTNQILQNYPDLLLYGALLQAAPFLGADERVQLWQGFYESAKEETRVQEFKSRTGGGILAMKPDVRVG